MLFFSGTTSILPRTIAEKNTCRLSGQMDGRDNMRCGLCISLKGRRCASAVCAWGRARETVLGNPTDGLDVQTMVALYGKQHTQQSTAHFLLHACPKHGRLNTEGATSGRSLLTCGPDDKTRPTPNRASLLARGQLKDKTLVERRLLYMETGIRASTLKAAFSPVDRFCCVLNEFHPQACASQAPRGKVPC